MTPVVFSDEERNDLRDARAFYAAVSAALAERFAVEVERAVRLIAEHPAAWTSIGHGLRRVVVHRFPYVLVYREGVPQHRVIEIGRAHV